MISRKKTALPKPDPHRQMQMLASVGFFVLFPVFFFFHLGIAHNLVPEFILSLLGGLYGRASFIILSIYGAIFCFWSFQKGETLKHNDQPWIFCFFWIYVIWALTYAAIHSVAYGSEQINLTSKKLVFDVCLQAGAFVVGCYLNVRKRYPLFPLLLILWIGMVLATFFHTGNGAQSLYLTLLNKGHSGFATYHGFARSFFMTTIVLASLTIQTPYRLALFTTSLATLFLIGARSEFLGCTLLVLVYEVGFANSNRDRIRSLVITTVICSVLGVIMGLIFYDFVSESRVWSLADLGLNSFQSGVDYSWNLRLLQLEFAFNQILDNLIWGSYGAHYAIGNEGDMPHNLLAAWLTLGLPGFLLMLGLCVASCWVATFRVVKHKFEDPARNCAFMISVVGTLLVLVAKSSFVEWLPLAFGSVVAASKNDAFSPKANN